MNKPETLTSTYYLQDACACSVICYFAPTRGDTNLPKYIEVKWGPTDRQTTNIPYRRDASMHPKTSNFLRVST
jgi:hypothetical protein